jgi:tRNA nucleotidyltransferase (CCA-adding enzyme)
MREEDLLEKLRKIERLYAGAATPGEKEAAAEALSRIRQRLQTTAKAEKIIEYRFTLMDSWAKKLFLALLRRYDLRPYRYARQRRNTVMVRVPRRFVDETLWPEFLELSEVLKTYLEDVTNRVIAQAIHEDAGEEEVVAGEYLGD